MLQIHLKTQGGFASIPAEESPVEKMIACQSG